MIKIQIKDLKNTFAFIKIGANLLNPSQSVGQN